MDKKMVNLLQVSHNYTKTLKAKATKKKKPSKEKTKKVHIDSCFKNGQIKVAISDNRRTEFFEDGSIKAQGGYIKDKKQGEWIFNRKGGQLLQTGNFVDDIKHGEWKRYDSKNIIVYHVLFKEGKVVDKLV